MFDNKYLKTIIIFLVLIEVIFVHLTIKSLENNPTELYDVKLRDEQNNDSFAVMLGDKEGIYTESLSSEWPDNSIYIYNQEKSGCVDNSGLLIEDSLNFDSSTQTVIVTTGETSHCYLYFDIDTIKPTVTVSVIENNTANPKVTITSNEEGLYCVNTSNEVENMTNCVLSGNVFKDTLITTDPFTKTGTYYVHTKDSAGNIEVSGELSIVVDKILSNNVKILATNVGTAGYRYQGASPNNYVTFNEETWRIIGVEEGSTIGLDSGKYYAKIIRNDAFLSIQYDAADETYPNGNPDWSGSDLYNTLNGDYYNRLNDYANTGLTEDSKELIVNVNWFYTTFSTSGTPNDFYTNERSDNTKVVKAAVGLMYPSDYGYAAPIIECGSIGLNYENFVTNTKCYEKDWLFESSYDQWTMVPFSGTYVWYVRYAGSVSYYYTYNTFAMRPTVYLDTNTIITGGNGTQNNMYTISKQTS